MTSTEKPVQKTDQKNEALRDSIVQRLKAHDAAIRSTLSTEALKTTPSKKQ